MGIAPWGSKGAIRVLPWWMLRREELLHVLHTQKGQAADARPQIMGGTEQMCQRQHFAAAAFAAAAAYFVCAATVLMSAVMDDGCVVGCDDGCGDGCGDGCNGGDGHGGKHMHLVVGRKSAQAKREERRAPPPRFVDETGRGKVFVAAFVTVTLCEFIYVLESKDDEVSEKTSR